MLFWYNYFKISLPMNGREPNLLSSNKCGEIVEIIISNFIVLLLILNILFVILIFLQLSLNMSLCLVFLYYQRNHYNHLI